MNEHLSRVSEKIEPYVLSFCMRNKEFRMDQLTDWVKNNVKAVAPDSAGRILRALKGRGLLNYEVVNRRASLYRITQIELQGALF